MRFWFLFIFALLTGCPSGSFDDKSGEECVAAAADTGGGYVKEICDGTDNDGDGEVDEEAVDASTWFVDSDGDGYGEGWGTNPDPVHVRACDAPAGYVADFLDCDDTDATTYPGAPEACGSADDKNCDWHVGRFDHDGDGFAACNECDDRDATTYPGAPETCDGADNDCDGEVDEGVKNTWYTDLDQDGYGDPGATTEACAAPASYVADGTDCDDGDATIHPGATELCDGVDNDCDGESP